MCMLPKWLAKHTKWELAEKVSSVRSWNWDKDGKGIHTTRGELGRKDSIVSLSLKEVEASVSWWWTWGSDLPFLCRQFCWDFVFFRDTGPLSEFSSHDNMPMIYNWVICSPWKMSSYHGPLVTISSMSCHKFLLFIFSECPVCWSLDPTGWTTSVYSSFLINQTADMSSSTWSAFEFLSNEIPTQRAVKVNNGTWYNCTKLLISKE